MKEQIQAQFKQRFGTDSVIYASAGRINLIGEHTDYNGGFVFPGAIDKYIMAAMLLKSSGHATSSVCAARPSSVVAQ